MPKKDFEEENTWLNDSICGHLQQNILQNPEALTGKSGKHIWGKHSDLNTDAWSMSNKWSKRMALIFAISVAVEAVCLSRAGRPPTFLQNQMQTSDTFTNAPWRTLHTKFRNRMRKKKKKLFRKARKEKTHSSPYVHLYIIWKADLLWNGWPKLHHNVKLIMKTPRLLSSPSWSETFQEVGNNHRRKFTGGTLTWYCYLDAWKPEASLELRRKWRTPFCFD